MNNATATPFKTIFQNPKTPTPAVAPKPIIQKQPEQKPSAPVALAESKKFWAYLSNKGRVLVMRYVATPPHDEAKLMATTELVYKDYTRLSTKAFKKWQDDAFDIASASTEAFDAKTRAAAQTIAEKQLAPAKAKFLAEKAKKSESKK